MDFCVLLLVVVCPAFAVVAYRSRSLHAADAAVYDSLRNLQDERAAFWRCRFEAHAAESAGDTTRADALGDQYRSHLIAARRLHATVNASLAGRVADRFIGLREWNERELRAMTDSLVL